MFSPQKTEDLKIGGEGFYFHNLFVGMSGTGKTTCAASYPSPYIFDFDHGVGSLSGLKGIEYNHYNSVLEFQAGLDEVQKLNRHKTLIFDSMSTLQYLVLVHFARINNHSDAKGNPDMKKVGLLEYGQRIQWFGSFFIGLSQLPFNTIIICHEELIKDDILGSILRQPSLPGEKLPAQSPAFFDEVYRFELGGAANPKDRITRVSTIADNLFPAKSRLRAKLPATIELRFVGEQLESLYDKILSYVK